MRSDECRMQNSQSVGISSEIHHSSLSTPQSLTWLPAAALATLLMLASSLSAFGAETRKSELKWRSPKTTTTAKNWLRDRSVRTVSHEEAFGPVLRVADQDTAAPKFNSLVTQPAEELPSPDTDQIVLQPANQTPNGLEREIEQPFTLPMEEPEPMPEPPTVPEEEPMPLPMDSDVGQPAVQPLVPDRVPAQPPAGRRDPFDRNEEEPRLPDPAPPGPTTLSNEQKEAEENCNDELEKLRSNTLNKLSLDISVTGTPGLDYPIDCTVDDGTPFQPRCWTEVTYMWKASALCHKPLYFECEQMERYGHSWGPVADPLIAGAHFFTRLPVLPYCMGITPPNECVYALGHYRPGSCAPYMIDPIPFTCRAAAFQAAATVGVVYFLP